MKYTVSDSKDGVAGVSLGSVALSIGGTVGGEKRRSRCALCGWIDPLHQHEGALLHATKRRLKADSSHPERGGLQVARKTKRTNRLMRREKGSAGPAPGGYSNQSLVWIWLTAGFFQPWVLDRPATDPSLGSAETNLRFLSQVRIPPQVSNATSRCVDSCYLVGKRPLATLTRVLIRNEPMTCRVRDSWAQVGPRETYRISTGRFRQCLARTSMIGQRRL